MSDVLCVGHSSYDISLFLPEYPAENSKAEVYQSMESGGGPAANAAYLIAKWGADCAIAALAGDDAYGAQIAREFAEVGVNASLLERRANHATPLSIILVNTTNASRTIINRKAQGQEAELSMVVEDFRRLGSKPKVLLFDGHELDASLEALEAFLHAQSILDAGSLRPGTAELARRVDYLVSSERFAKQFTGIADLQSESNQAECLRRLQEANGRQVVVTLGERGLIYWKDEAFGAAGVLGAMPAFPANAIDTTGAGDIFHGAFAWGILNEMPLKETLRHASMAAAISVESRGARQSIPSLEQVKQRLRKNTETK